MKNIFSVDVEDWFCVHNFAHVIPFSQWAEKELRIEKNVDTILMLLEKYNVQATFFTLGWIVEQRPELIKKIEAGGHELASHGYAHLLVKELTPQKFEDDLVKSLEVLARYSSQKILGFRAPSFSVTEKKPWIFEILAKHGIQYDSSIYPVAFHPDYANNGSPLSIHTTPSGVIEIPLSCFKMGPLTLPCSGGGYFRFFPYWYSAYGIEQCNRNNRPAVFYIHPWEIDPDQPRVTDLPLTKRFRHYVNLRKTEQRLERLLSQFEFTTVAALLKEHQK